MIGLLLAIQSINPQTISLNDGWKFVNLPNPPSIWRGVDAVPISQWRVVQVSSQEAAGENAISSRAFDGDPKTFWHTKWFEGAAPYPHDLIIDLGVKTEVAGFRLLPRQSGPMNGRPNHIQIFLSENMATWGNPIVSDAVPNTSNLFQRLFSPVSARYLRLMVTDGHRGIEPFLAIAEIGLIRNLDAKAKKDWESQYHIATVETGDDRFDLKDKALDNIKTDELAKVRPSEWKNATLPHAAWIRPLNKTDIWQGVTYYKRDLDIAPGDLKASLELSIGAAMQVSDLWLNGEHIATRRGGYFPLVANLTGKAKAHNEIIVRLDNRDNPLVPPGKPQTDLDFMYGTGIHREAKLEIQDLIHNPRCFEGEVGHIGVVVSTVAVKDGLATLKIQTCVHNDTDKDQDVRVWHLLDGREKTEDTIRVSPHGFGYDSQTIEIKDPTLWSPSSPNLHKLTTQIIRDHNPPAVDIRMTKFGIRTIKVSRERGFELNGKTLELIGTNRHQDYPWVGPALSRQANYRDAKLIKEAGHNIVRLSHYPQSGEFLDACDELGILTIPCIAGWQFLNKDPRFENQVKRDIQELIQRDARHPCVAWFETSLNETYPDNITAQSWADAARSTIVGKSILLAGDARPGAPWDIAYNQWNDEDFSRPQDAMPNKPGYIREYGDYEFGGTGSSSRIRIRQGIDKLLGETWNHIWSVNHLRPQLPWTMGYGTWEMFDHNVPYGDGVSASGLCDLFRIKKPSFYFYKSQSLAPPYRSRAKIYVKMVADWQPGAPTRRVVVFTNCLRAVLSLDGKEIARKDAVRGPSTTYERARTFDGSNTANLTNCPIVFENVPYRPGKLTVSVTGFDTRTSDSIVTAGAPDHIKVWIDDQGIPAGRNDLVFVRAAVVDKNGTICPHDDRLIDFVVTGASLAGESTVKCEMGVASALVRTPLGKTSVQISAQSGSLKTGVLKMEIP